MSDDVKEEEETVCPLKSREGPFPHKNISTKCAKIELFTNLPWSEYRDAWRYQKTAFTARAEAKITNTISDVMVKNCSQKSFCLCSIKILDLSEDHQSNLKTDSNSILKLTVRIIYEQTRVTRDGNNITFPVEIINSIKLRLSKIKLHLGMSENMERHRTAIRRLLSKKQTGAISRDKQKSKLQKEKTYRIENVVCIDNSVKDFVVIEDNTCYLLLLFYFFSMVIEFDAFRSLKGYQEKLDDFAAANHTQWQKDGAYPSEQWYQIDMAFEGYYKILKGTLGLINILIYFKSVVFNQALELPLGCTILLILSILSYAATLFLTNITSLKVYCFILQFGAVLWSYMFSILKMKIESKTENGDQNKKRRIDYNNRIYLHENFSLYAIALASIIGIYKFYLYYHIYMRTGNISRYTFTLIMNLLMGYLAFYKQRSLRINMIKIFPQPHAGPCLCFDGDHNKKEQLEKFISSKKNCGRFTNFKKILYDRANPHWLVVELLRLSLYFKFALNVFNFLFDHVLDFYFIYKLWLTKRDCRANNYEEAGKEATTWFWIYFMIWLVANFTVLVQTKWDIKNFAKKDEHYRKSQVMAIKQSNEDVSLEMPVTVESDSDENNPVLLDSPKSYNDNPKFKITPSKQVLKKQKRPARKFLEWLVGPIILSWDIINSKTGNSFFKSGRQKAIKMILLFFEKYPQLCIELYIQRRLFKTQTFDELPGCLKTLADNGSSEDENDSTLESVVKYFHIPFELNFENLIKLKIAKSLILGSMTFAGYRNHMMKIGDAMNLFRLGRGDSKIDHKKYDLYQLKHFPTSKIMGLLAYILDFLAQFIFITLRCKLMIFVIVKNEKIPGQIRYGLSLMMNHVFLFYAIGKYRKYRIDKRKKSEKGIWYNFRAVKQIKKVAEQQYNKSVAEKTFSLWDSQIILEEREYLPFYSLTAHDISGNLYSVLINYLLLFLEFWMIPGSAAWLTDKYLWIPNSYPTLVANLVLSVFVIFLYEVHVLYENE